ncbi:hypothetical protein ACFQGW_08370 [Xanthomonas theicola]|uniref:hypothetical protein n=1 Tax=Xanthomonas theicola TaxID=56464 RepID=UPI0011B07B28|nr:hypothetical protein G4Q83_00965 [Xanthomonas theicola]
MSDAAVAVRAEACGCRLRHAVRADRHARAVVRSFMAASQAGAMKIASRYSVASGAAAGIGGGVRPVEWRPLSFAQAPPP